MDLVRIIYTLNEIAAIMPNDVNMGTTYSIERIIVCNQEEAYLFFASYPPEEIAKLDAYFNNSVVIPSPYEYIDF